MTPISADETTREIFQTEAAKAYLGQERRLGKARQSVGAAGQVAITR
jgi:hypothetical protein